MQKRYLMATAFLGATLFSLCPRLQAKDPASDPCSMIPAADVSKVLGQPFTAAIKTVAPAAGFDRITGTDCTYRMAKGETSRLLFRIYFDPSPEIANDTFVKLSAYYGPNRKLAGRWDLAYVDASHAVHVQKGKVRYAFKLTPLPSDSSKVDKELADLAALVAGQL